MFGIEYDVCDVSLIYDKSSGYEYSLPRTILEGFLTGKAFDHPNFYSLEESRNLRDDINELYQNILSRNPIKENMAIITAGAPGAGKTIKLRQKLEENASKGRNFAYICPDDVCLQHQTRTYKADLEKSEGSKEARQDAYNKWRPGSNASTHLILANLIREKYAFYFGTTSSGFATNIFFNFLKKQHYQIRLIHITAPDDIRWESIKERDKTFIQTTEQDIKEKGLLLPQRINDTFLAYADEIEFYYRDEVQQDAQLAAKWIRNTDNSESLGTLQIISISQYDKIKMNHNAAIEVLKRPDLSWELTVEKNSQIFNKI
ncbi:zeta toxin family protein [Candidatus Protochlamydia phocaeensis]|uniref:zeta toxin family protein n=1 Tax=Candidatus Protochlamydia phocaeensis TaxID=1414722 RepID=UPI000837DEC0|nr:zeta toxin family protein [Candidatus Protochlamydia phocaeensis]